VGIYCGGEARDEAREGDGIDLLVEETPFYGESGGQAGDPGLIRCGDGEMVVEETRRSGAGIVHRGRITRGAIRRGALVELAVDPDSRHDTMRNHSATHLLHATLREVLGGHVHQAGSLVTSERLRFDYTHFRATEREELDRIEEVVNARVLANAPVETTEMAREEALSQGAMALFGEKYGDVVRVVRIGDYSTELCGGTHTRSTGEIGLVKVVADGGIASGVRRIEALTGQGTLLWAREQERLLRAISESVLAGGGDVREKVIRLKDELKERERELERLRAKLSAGASADLAAGAVVVQGIRVLGATVEAEGHDRLREMADHLKQRLGTGVIALGAVAEGKVFLVVAVTADLTARLHAGKLVKELALRVGGSGGGRADMAQAGGKDVDGLPGAMKGFVPLVEKALSA
jgi:alanyl-tRNA synthetase